MDPQLPLRPIQWVGSSLKDLKEMPEDVRDAIGFSLFQVQVGRKPLNASIMRGFSGASVLEIKDDFDGDTYRCIYTIRFPEAVYVLHAFMKKSTRGIETSKNDIHLVKARLKIAEAHYAAAHGT